MNQEQVVTDMFNQISSTYDKVNRVLSFGMDRLWRKKMIQKIAKGENLSLLDIATGTGDVLIEALEQNKISMAVGLDLSEKMLEIAYEKLKRSPFLSQANLIKGSALSLPFENHFFDAVTISYGIRNVQNVSIALKEMYRVLKDKGQALILEFSLPKNILLKKLHLIYLRKCLPKIGGWLSKSTSSYEYLNKTIETFPYGENFLSLFEEAGFQNCQAHPIMGGITTLYIGDK